MKIKFKIFEKPGFITLKVESLTDYVQHNISNSKHAMAVHTPEIKPNGIFMPGIFTECNHQETSLRTSTPKAYKQKIILWMKDYFEDSPYYKNVRIIKHSNTEWSIVATAKIPKNRMAEIIRKSSDSEFFILESGI